MIKTSDIRSKYLHFFEEEGHEIIESSSLIPENDPTILFTNAGMVQFKDIFTGRKTSQFKRATTAQKCLRAGGKHNDLDNVGYTARHHTFFEMLGNFSFGDYFKEKAISLAWEFVTKELGLSKEKLLVTVHSSDEEAASIWEKVTGWNDSKIIRISTNDNFWSMGDTGPCGPCTEIFFDHGDKVKGGIPGSLDADGDRFVEIWNLVFMQYETLKDGTRVNLPKPSIDTGMGLERVTAILQGVDNNFDIDIFKTIISDIKNVTNIDDPKFLQHYNVIADHIRAISFMIVDGVIPSNEGRGYVLRRIIRRALRYGYTMGMREPFLFRLVTSVEKVMGDHYREIGQNLHAIVSILESEEVAFMKTIDKGMTLLVSELDKMGEKSNFEAETAYKLYDTYGFPIDLTQDVLKNRNKSINIEEFERISNAHKEEAKKEWRGSGEIQLEKVWLDLKDEGVSTEFVRDCDFLESKIVKIIKNNAFHDSLQAGESGFIITLKSCFYPESGGQVGDIGTISRGAGNLIKVLETQKISDTIIHRVLCEEGRLSSGDVVDLRIDNTRRLLASRNHTCTHVLHSVLRKILGKHVSQKGSFVSDRRLRFDFLHNDPISDQQVSLIENGVNDAIDKGYNVLTGVIPLKEAIDSGAMALFGEKYKDSVRVVSIGDSFSKELCGGTHIKNTSSIKFFKIVSLSSIGSGIKRIEAVTGNGVIEYLSNSLSEMSSCLEEKKSYIKCLERQVKDMKTNSAISDITFKTTSFNSCQVKEAYVKDFEYKLILSVIDQQKQCGSEKIIAIVNKNTKSGKNSICLFVSDCFLPNLSAVKLMSEAAGSHAKVGGKSHLAVASGIEDDKITEISHKLKQFIENFMENQKT